MNGGVKHIFITPTHAQANSAERVNRNLNSMLKAYCSKKQDTWIVHLSSFRFALNSAVHEKTGVSPAELTFGEKMLSPLENNFTETEVLSSSDYKEYQENLVGRMNELKKIIEPVVAKAKERQARNYNKHRREASFKPGDQVLVREHPLSSAVKKFSAKLAESWGGPFNVLEVKNKVNLVLEDVRRDGRQRTVHVCDVKPYAQRQSDLQADGEVAETLGADHQEFEEPPRHTYNLR
jgi:hypothetical protein